MARLLPPVSNLHTPVLPLQSPVTLTYASPGDANGVAYLLGTAFGTIPWTNPHNSLQCVVVRSSSENGSESDLVNRATENTHTANVAGSWVTIDLGVGRSLIVADYVLQNRSFADRAMRNWKLRESNDVASNTITDIDLATWVDIDVRVSDATMAVAANAFAHYSVSPTPGGGRWLQILSTGLNSGGDNYLTLAEFEFYGVFSF